MEKLEINNLRVGFDPQFRVTATELPGEFSALIQLRGTRSEDTSIPEMVLYGLLFIATHLTKYMDEKGITWQE